MLSFRRIVEQHSKRKRGMIEKLDRLRTVGTQTEALLCHHFNSKYNCQQIEDRYLDPHIQVKLDNLIAPGNEGTYVVRNFEHSSSNVARKRWTSVKNVMKAKTIFTKASQRRHHVQDITITDYSDDITNPIQSGIYTRHLYHTSPHAYHPPVVHVPTVTEKKEVPKDENGTAVNKERSDSHRRHHRDHKKNSSHSRNKKKSHARKKRRSDVPPAYQSPQLDSREEVSNKNEAVEVIEHNPLKIFSVVDTPTEDKGIETIFDSLQRNQSKLDSQASKNFASFVLQEQKRVKTISRESGQEEKNPAEKENKTVKSELKLELTNNNSKAVRFDPPPSYTKLQETYTGFRVIQGQPSNAEKRRSLEIQHAEKRKSLELQRHQLEMQVQHLKYHQHREKQQSNNKKPLETNHPLERSSARNNLHDNRLDNLHENQLDNLHDNRLDNLHDNRLDTLTFENGTVDTSSPVTSPLNQHVASPKHIFTYV